MTRKYCTLRVAPPVADLAYVLRTWAMRMVATSVCRLIYVGASMTELLL